MRRVFLALAAACSLVAVSASQAPAAKLDTGSLGSSLTALTGTLRVDALSTRSDQPDGRSTTRDVNACSDGADNDHDGLTDAQDSDCYDVNGHYNSGDTYEAGTCGVRGSEGTIPPPTANTGDCGGTTGSPQCSDGRDNDGDGLADRSDPGCHTDGNAGNAGSYNAADNDERNGTTTPQCSDAFDNDGDGLSDRSDPGCHSDGNAGNVNSYVAGDDDERDGTTTTPRTPECRDGIDNDSDHKVDYPADTGCSSPDDTNENNGTTTTPPPTVSCGSSVDQNTRPANGPISGLLWDVGQGLIDTQNGFEQLGAPVQDIACVVEEIDG